jgi:hypothetical protein
MGLCVAARVGTERQGQAALVGAMIGHGVKVFAIAKRGDALAIRNGHDIGAVILIA